MAGHTDIKNIKLNQLRRNIILFIGISFFFILVFVAGFAFFKPGERINLTRGIWHEVINLRIVLFQRHPSIVPLEKDPIIGGVQKSYLPLVLKNNYTPTATATITRTPTATATITPSPISNPIYPLKASSNRRYLVDQKNVPFLIAGDSPHGLFGGVSLADAEIYLAGAYANGINAIWVELLCSNYSDICPDYTTYDGIAPFGWNGSDPDTFDLASPNETYFSRMDAMVNLTAKYNIVVFLDPIETGGWLQVLRNNGTSKDYNYGVYLGKRYKNFANIVWLNGNDFQTWSDPSDDAVVQAVANGIKSVDANHLQTVELDYDSSDSLKDASWGSIISLNSAYSYYPQYDRMLTAYNRTVSGNHVPAYFIEGVYEYQGYEGGYQGPHELRAQEYWVMLSGACGQLYGNANLYPFPSGWQNSGWQTTPGISQFKIMNIFFNLFPWYNLVPDQNHTVVTSGYGTYAKSGLGNTSNYLTAARTTDGKLVIAYMPTRRSISVDMTKLSGTATARWFDPTNGTFTNISSSPFANTGSKSFSPPGNNSNGEGDWVLVLEVK